MCEATLGWRHAKHEEYATSIRVLAGTRPVGKLPSMLLGPRTFFGFHQTRIASKTFFGFPFGWHRLEFGEIGLKEIVGPAGTKAIGQLAHVNQNGQIGLHFNSLEMPDGTTETIEGSSLSLGYGPIKGSVSGRNRAKRVLVRSLTGIGSMAAYPVAGLDMAV